MISRILFIALEDCISVVSLSEKGKRTQIPFDGEITFKLHDDFWRDWCAQTSYLAPKNEDDSDATICDFCFVMDKDYSFAKDEFLKKVIMVKDSSWTVKQIIDVLQSVDIMKKYHEAVIKMPNEISFSVRGSSDDKASIINATTNISDENYKLYLEEKAKQKEKREAARKKIAEEKEDTEEEKIVFSKPKPKKKRSKKVKGEESPLVKFNKKLLEEEKANE